MQNIIQMEDVSFSYGENTVLEDINLNIQRGEFVGIIGSNGAGKTTLIRLLLGQIKEQKGSIKVFDESGNISKRENIGYVSQSQDKNQIHFPATVTEVVMMNLYREIPLFSFSKKPQIEKAESALEKLDMLSYKDRMISNLSGGQRQRVMIAKSIVNSPEILVLDEPTTGVDRDSSFKIYNLLKKLNEELNLTIIIISHDIKNLKKYCSQMYEIEFGKIKKMEDFC